MSTQKTSGTQAATISTEHDLATIADAGTYVLVVDLSNLANGDVVTLRAKTKLAGAGDTEKQAFSATFANAQTDVQQYSIPVQSPHSLTFTLEQRAGTGRSFPWAIYEA